MKSHTDVDADTDTKPRRPFPPESLGTAAVRLEIDRDTYERLQVGYRLACRHGYTDEFAMYAYNHCMIGNETITVDGEPLSDVADPADLDDTE